MKLLVISLESNPFNTDLFNEFASRGIDLSVLFLVSRASRNNSAWSQEFETRFLTKIAETRFAAFREVSSSIFSRKYERIVITGWSKFACVYAIFLCVLLRQSFFLWADTLAGSKPTSLFSSIFRPLILFLVRMFSDGVLTTGVVGRKSFRRLGFHPEKIVDFPYSASTSRLLGGISSSFDLGSNLKEKCRDRVIILFSGQLIHRKGLDVLLRAISKISDFESRLFLVVEGKGPLLGFYENMVVDLGLQSCVEFVGFQQQAIHSSLLSTADIVVVPSRWDPWGNLVHEGMVFGKSVIASDGVASAVDRIESGSNGYIYPSEGEPILLRQLNLLIDSKETRERLGEAAKVTSSFYGVGRNVDVFLGYCNQVLPK